MPVHNDVSPLEAAGERFHPEMSGNIALEHMHRYIYASAYAKGKAVLDIASREGYGSALLARHADVVTGVDIAENAVAHARQKYQRPNLEFRLGSCSKIPLEDRAVDLVVSFETIEHHDEHAQMLAEIKRVLKPGGMVIVSSPDKAIYADKPNYHNPFHIKELYRDEFEALFRRNFANVVCLGQKVMFGSGIIPDTGSPKTAFVSGNLQNLASGPKLPEAMYNLVLASDAPLPAAPLSFLDVGIETSEIVKAALARAQQLAADVARLQANAADRDAQIVKGENDLASARAELEQTKERLGDSVARHQAELSQKSALIAKRESDIASARAELEQTKARHEEVAARLHADIVQKDTRIAERANDLASTIAELEQTKAQLEAIEKKAAAYADQMDKIKGLLFWKVHEFFYSISQVGPQLLRLASRRENGKHRRPRFRTGSANGDFADTIVALPLGYQPPPVRPIPRVAVLFHAYYVADLPDFQRALRKIPFSFALFVSTDTEQKRTAIEERFVDWKHGPVEVRAFPNRGRDIAPKFVGFRDVHRDYEFVLHIHTKKSPHNDFGEWRPLLLDCLLGSPEIVAGVFELFSQCPALGIVAPRSFPRIRHCMTWDVNFDKCARLAERMGIALRENSPIDFAAGSMFWARSAALKPLLDLNLTFDDFDKECGQTDGALAHAVERLTFYSSEAAGYGWCHAGPAKDLAYFEKALHISSRDDLGEIPHAGLLSAKIEYPRVSAGSDAFSDASYRQQTLETREKNWLTSGLLSYRDPLSYRHCSLAELVTSDDDVLWLDRPAEPYVVSERSPSFHDHVSPPVLVPELSGTPPSTKSASYIMAKSDILLSGYRAFIGRDRHYNLDESFTTKKIEAIETARLGHPEVYRNEMIGFKDTEVPAVFRFDVSGKSFREIAEPIICLSSNEPTNYGSFLVRIFPKLIHVANLPDHLKILVPDYLPTLKSHLELAGIDVARIVPQSLDCIYDIKKVIVPSMRNRDLWLDNETLRFYDGLRERYGESSGSDRRIYITRRNFTCSAAAPLRIMINESELIEELEHHGFDVIAPENLSARQQIELFSSASIVIGAGGSALFSAVFCRPGTKLIHIEAEPHWARAHALLFASRGLDFGLFEGTPSTYDFSKPHIPFSVDVSRFSRRLRSFLAGY